MLKKKQQREGGSQKSDIWKPSPCRDFVLPDTTGWISIIRGRRKWGWDWVESGNGSWRQAEAPRQWLGARRGLAPHLLTAPVLCLPAVLLFMECTETVWVINEVYDQTNKCFYLSSNYSFTFLSGKTIAHTCEEFQILSLESEPCGFAQVLEQSFWIRTSCTTEWENRDVHQPRSEWRESGANFSAGLQGKQLLL